MTFRPVKDATGQQGCSNIAQINHIQMQVNDDQLRNTSQTEMN